MPALFLTDADVADLIDMESAIEVIEEAFRRLAEGEAENVPRARVRAPGIMLHTMSGGAEYLGRMGFKAYTTTAGGARFHVAVYDAASGELAGFLEADVLGQLRTGAASGVAAEYMARPDATVVGVFGAGRQARAQLKAVCTVRRIERAYVFSRSGERSAVFCEEMTELCATEVVPVPTPDLAAAEKDIVITATTSKEPVFDGRWLDEGTHLNVIGSNFLSKTEIDVTTVKRANHIVCDSIAQCRLEAGDFVAALEEGATDWRLMHELADVVSGRQTGRATPDDITLFKSVGLAIEDVALAAHVLDRAREEGLGQALPF
ncbi:MAG TPA: ornithine cyclodeaminase family protein [Planctomycetaceae bacterium]|nr:ornithine cyclodeaminase family protein [Planctomycetaceae bacterium]